MGAAALLFATPAEASITLGQVMPSGATSQNCGPSSGAYTQPTVTSGPSYTVPANGVRITSWSTVALATSAQKVRLFVFRPLGGDVYMSVAHDGPKTLTPSSLNTFQVNIAVKPGDLLGLDAYVGTNFPTACGFVVGGEAGEFMSYPNPPPVDGASETFSSNPGNRVNVSAEIEVSNAFSFVGTTRNKKKGRATTTVSVLGPGNVAVGGKGLAAQSRHTDGGTVDLGVIPNKKTRKKLLAKGKARVTASFTYTPDGGTANTQPEKIKLILR
jgi:hypothetical protein